MELLTTAGETRWLPVARRSKEVRLGEIFLLVSEGLDAWKAFKEAADPACCPAQNGSVMGRVQEEHNPTTN